MKKINEEKILLIYIILLPVLDMSSFIFRAIFHTSWSASTIIRPIIPLTVFIIIFLKNNYKIKTTITVLIYAIYSVIHIFIFYKLKTGISYGSEISELQYLINYTFNILTLFTFIFIFYKKNNINFKKYIIISYSIYIFGLYLSIITNTYSHTYVEGIGIKGWFESGNSLGVTLILGLFILLSLLNNSIKKTYLILLIAMSSFFLLVLLGTRTAMFGALITSLLYIIIFIFYKLKNRLKITKKIILFFSIIVVLIIIAIFLIGSKTLERRRYLSSLNSSTDVHTGNVLHVTADLADINYRINNNLISDDYMSIAEQKAVNSMYSFANIHQISSTNRRLQQLVYNIYLVKYQANFFSFIFGNGLLNNYAELTLEMELPAFILNFGLLGFILYFIPFFIALIYCIKSGYENPRIIDIEYLMLIFGLLFAFASSIFTGITFFNTSTATFVSLIIVLLINKKYEKGYK